MNISRYIDTNYNIALQGRECIDVEKAEAFLLCESYTTLGNRIINAGFIDTFSKESDVVLVEGVPSGIPSTSSSMLLERKLEVIGWDHKDAILLHPGMEKQMMHMMTFISKASTTDEKIVAAQEFSKSYQIASTPFTNPLHIRRVKDKMNRLLESRSNSLLSSLDSTKNAGKRGFLIAETSHLTNARLSSKALFLDLQTRNVVVLEPKQENATQIHNVIVNMMRNLP